MSVALTPPVMLSCVGVRSRASPVQVLDEAATNTSIITTASYNITYSQTKAIVVFIFSTIHAGPELHVLSFIK